MKKKLKEETLQYWKKQAQISHSLILFHGSDVLDLTKFAKIHPGSEKSVTKFRFHNIQPIFKEIYPHKSSSLKTLKNYIVGRLKAPSKEKKGSQKKQEKKVTFLQKVDKVGKEKEEIKQECLNGEEIKVASNKGAESQQGQCVSKTLVSCSCSDSSRNHETDVFQEHKLQIFIPRMSTKFFNKKNYVSSSLRQDFTHPS